MNITENNLLLHETDSINKTCDYFNLTFKDVVIDFVTEKLSYLNYLDDFLTNNFFYPELDSAYKVEFGIDNPKELSEKYSLYDKYASRFHVRNYYTVSQEDLGIKVLYHGYLECVGLSSNSSPDIYYGFSLENYPIIENGDFYVSLKKRLDNEIKFKESLLNVVREKIIKLNEIVELYKLEYLEIFETLEDLNKIPKDFTAFLLRKIMESQSGPSYKFIGDKVTSIQIIPKEEEIKNIREFLGL